MTLQMTFAMTALAAAFAFAGGGPEGESYEGVRAYGEAAPSSSTPRAMGILQDDDEPPTEKALVQRYLSILKGRKSTKEEKAAAMEELLRLGTRGPSELGRYLGSEFESSHKRNEKAFSKLMAKFDKVAPKMVAGLLDRKADAALEGHRSVIAKNARRAELTKDEIKETSDKAYDAIVELLTIKPGDVWDAQPELYEDWVSLLDAADVEAALRENWGRAHDALAAVGEEGEKLAARLRAPKAMALSADTIQLRIEQSAEMARPMAKADRKAFAANRRLADDPQSGLLPEEVAGVRDLNLRLVLIGLPAQTIDVKLCAACRDHSKDMHELGFFSHESPVDGKKSFTDRASNFGTSSGSENIAMGASSGGGAILQWWYSPGHHKNLLRGATRVGLGQHERHWTQNFG